MTAWKRYLLIVLLLCGVAIVVAWWLVPEDSWTGSDYTLIDGRVK